MMTWRNFGKKEVVVWVTHLEEDLIKITLVTNDEAKVDCL